MNTVKTIGRVNHSRTSEFQQAVFLNYHQVAFEILDSLLKEGWYPENKMDAWADIAVEDDIYYAVFGEDSVGAEDAKCIYVEIEPTEEMISDFEYFKQF